LVFTHRDPVAVIQSTITMQAYTQRMQRPSVEMAWLRDYWVARIEHLLRACVRDRALARPGRSVDCPFHVFMRDPWKILDEVYTKAQLPLTAQARGQLEHYLAAHPRGKAGQVLYDIKRDFDLDPHQLRGRFAFYLDRFEISAENH
jgi:hypothetical protein